MALTPEQLEQKEREVAAEFHNNHMHEVVSDEEMDGWLHDHPVPDDDLIVPVLMTNEEETT
jgi:hypothetical protein